MFGLMVRFEVRPDTADAFDALVARTIPLVAEHEPGTIVYAAHRIDGEPNARLFYELYRDRAAFDEHADQPHIHRFVAGWRDLLAGPPRMKFLALSDASGVPVPADV
ncbi:Antibiotic biosynthesis monooxygenase [Frankia canadensis]|uniref:Antibiotic biosynthesis monooxygenase n=1 Tax=Frankia canadensis TaxID=1836972 RepID=A0A2I2KSR4_9ACTN|nr:putative quinol monooxygenase [Frankia canadensis]SNQ48676.1 Antibiotic biosynthesis monooxygenase [Frankia canadensis]SOU55966.1 Antibiotic biosynthesis monooxygenase [Frankia canadensis]